MSILFKGDLEEGNYTLIKSTDGWVLKGETSYVGFNFADHKDEPQTEQWHYDEQDNTWYPYQHKSCATCKHALGNWDGESNNCGRCCGADRRFYESIEDEPQTDCAWK